MSRRSLLTLLGPVGLAVVVAVGSRVFSDGVQLQFRSALVVTTMVVGLYVFSGNSGVISFGHVSFVAIGAFTAGLASLEAQRKGSVFPELFPFIRNHSVGNVMSLLLAAALGAVFALVVGTFLSRLSGLGASIATFAVLGITRNVLRNWNRIGPGAKAIPSVPQTSALWQASAGLVVAVVVAWRYQTSRFGRRLRATRDDPAAAAGVGISIYRERLTAFVVSGTIAGFAGGLYVHLLGSVTTEQVYIPLAFITLAMLVIGGTSSLWGAVVGGLAVSLFDSLLNEAQKGLDVGPISFALPAGTRDIVLAMLMAAVLLLRPTGLTRGREFAARRWFRYER
jgi:branched-chain amino acid transport system permease protein